MLVSHKNDAAMAQELLALGATVDLTDQVVVTGPLFCIIGTNCLS